MLSTGSNKAEHTAKEVKSQLHLPVKSIRLDRPAPLLSKHTASSAGKRASLKHSYVGAGKTLLFLQMAGAAFLLLN